MQNLAKCKDVKLKAFEIRFIVWNQVEIISIQKNLMLKKLVTWLQLMENLMLLFGSWEKAFSYFTSDLVHRDIDA